MILQALVDYYDRERARPDSALAPPGWIRRTIDYELVLNEAGQCVQLNTAFERVKNRPVGRSVLLPNIGKQALKHTNSGTDANLLWDNASFVLGRGKKGDTKLRSFLETLDRHLGTINDAGVAAVRHFLERLLAAPDEREALPARFGSAADFAERDPILAFRLASDVGLVHERPGIADLISEQASSDGDTSAPAGVSKHGQCLVTGALDQPIATSETVIKGVRGGQTSGANIMSFNARAFESYGKTERQGENAPIGATAMFAYTTALNHLLREGSANRTQIGDASTVIWSEGLADHGDWFAALFGDNPESGVAAVRSQYEAISTGRLPGDAGSQRFCVLGLAAPSKARLTVRFWLQAPFAELAPRVLQHFDDLAIVRQFDSDPRTPPLWRLLGSLALQHKSDNVPPRLAGEWMRAILAGTAYPPALLQAAVIRSRAEREVPYLRAAILKACLNRQRRAAGAAQPLFKEELDVDNDDNAYRLGRLFAVLERIQQRAQPGINATIRDRYFGAASTSPASVFTTLLRLKNAHLKKLGDAETTHFERLIGEICGDLDQPRLQRFPSQLSLAEQGAFALGYYHQRQSFFKPRPDGAHDNTPQED